MKNFNILVAHLFLFSLVSSCQPKDISLLNNNNNAAGSQSSSNSMSQVELDRLLSVSLERSAEPLHYLKAVLNPDYLTTSKLQINTNAETGEQTLVNTKALEKIETPTRIFQNFINYDVINKLTDADGKLKSLVLSKNLFKSGNAKGFIKAADGKTVDFSTTLKKEFVSITESSAGHYKIVVNKYEDSSSKADAQSTIETAFVADLEWDGLVASLDQPLKLKINYLEVTRAGSRKSGVIKIKSSDASFTVSLASCVSLSGAVVLSKEILVKEGTKTVPKIIPTTIQALDSTFTFVDSNFTSAAQSCETRPLVDLSRML